VDSPRVLRLTFELRVPPGLRANIYGSRVTTAVSAFTAAIQSLAATVFPWANELSVTHTWSYEWSKKAKTHVLPASDKNTTTTTAGIGD
jgi:hypothetical protein